MKKLMQGGFLFVLFGVTIADSSSLIPSLILISSGIIMLGTGRICAAQR